MQQKILRLVIYLTIFLLPAYLIRFSIGWLPANLLEIMIGLSLLIWLIKRNVKHLVFNISYAVFFIFLGATLATWFSTDLMTSAGIWKSWFILPMLFAWIVLSVIEGQTQVKQIILTLFLSGIGVSLTAVYFWLIGDLTYDGRWRAFYLSPNHLAMYLSPILILSLYLWPGLKKNLHKIIFLLAFALLALVIYFTYSWGAWLGLTAAFLVLALIKKKKIALVILLAAFLLLTSQYFSTKLPAAESRLMIWRSAWTIIKDHPFLGIGPGLFQKYYLTYQVEFPPYLEWAVPQPHNLFLAFWLQTGLLGLLGFFWLLVYFFRRANKFSLIITAALLAILVHGLVDTTYWKNDLSVIFWLLIALSYKGVHSSD